MQDVTYIFFLYSIGHAQYRVRKHNISVGEILSLLTAPLKTSAMFYRPCFHRMHQEHAALAPDGVIVVYWT